MRLLLVLLMIRLRLAPCWLGWQLRRHPVRCTAVAFGLMLAVFIVIADALPGPKPPAAGCTWQRAPQETMVLVCNRVSSTP